MAAGREFDVGDGEAGLRLDRFLQKLLRRVPRGAIFRHLREGRIRVDGQKAKPDLRLQPGMVVRIALPDADLDAAAAPRAGAPAPGDGASAAASDRDPAAAPSFTGRPPRIVHRDRDLLVVDKPAGMASQPGSGQGDTHLLAWLEARGLGEPSATFRPAPVHRIDRGTSGLVVIGLTPLGLRAAAAAFREDLVHKVYLAVVHGVPRQRTFTIDAPLLVRENARKQDPKVDVDPRGKPSRTDVAVLEATQDRALLRVVLHTGRMHQIRAHLAHAGHPIVGDARYGSRARERSLLLHAAELTLPHPVSGEPVHCVAPRPAGFWRSS